MSFLCETVSGKTVQVIVSGVVHAGPGGRKQNVTAAEDFFPSDGLRIAGSATDRKAEDAPGHSERPYFNQNGLKFNLFAVVVYFIGKAEKTLKTQIKGIKTKTEKQGKKNPPWWAIIQNNKI